METVKIGLMGLGTVGSGVIEGLQKNYTEIKEKSGLDFEVKKIMVKDKQKKRALEVDVSKLVTDPGEILKDREIAIVVELIGGCDEAKEYVLKALESGKDVVTANKDLIATHGKELFKKAKENKRQIYFEGSVAGGIPLIKPLQESLSADKIEKVIGILNGTTNYILTKMTDGGYSFDSALEEAKTYGFSEPDPTNDISGLDAAYKLAILSYLSFGTLPDMDEVYCGGIENVSQRDIQYAKKLGMEIKLLGIGENNGKGVFLTVVPCMISVEHPIASVKGENNALFVRGNLVGEIMFYGPGAGSLPTGSAVLSDIIKAGKELYKKPLKELDPILENNKYIITPREEIEASFYLRIVARDKPGVFSEIAGVFGNFGVSLESIIQEKREDESAEIVLLTHKTKIKNLDDAITDLKERTNVYELSNVIQVEKS